MLQPDNTLLFHQIKPDEADALLAYLEGQLPWAQDLRAQNITGGTLLKITKAGRGSCYIRQRPVAPFVL